MGLDFVPTALSCGAVTGFAFFTGLRIGRVLYSPLGMPGGGMYNDAMLSVSIGAATGAVRPSVPCSLCMPAALCAGTRDQARLPSYYSTTRRSQPCFPSSNFPMA